MEDIQVQQVEPSKYWPSSREANVEVLFLGFTRPQVHQLWHVLIVSQVFVVETNGFSGWVMQLALLLSDLKGVEKDSGPMSS